MSASSPPQPFDWTTFHMERTAAARSASTELQNRHRDAHFYFFALYTSGDVRKLVDERAPIQAERAKAITASDYVHAQRIRRQAQRAMNQFFAD